MSSTRQIILGPTLETERLILRPFDNKDFDAFAAMFGNEQDMEFLGGAVHRATAWRAFASNVGSWVLRGHGMFSVIEKSTGTWIGRIGPIRPECWPGTEVGWGLIHQAWGKGYATEAATACIDWAFNHLGWSDVIHCIDEQNVNSRKVAQRLGSRLLRANVSMPPPYEDDKQVSIWGQSCKEWRARRRQDV
jgi:RimJ/RimL family protein N-acetyltransferase